MSTKLEKLRKILNANDLCGFIVPHKDEYGAGEAVPAAERLKWLTGFSGSAGVAFVFKEKAFLLLDGRYTLGAKKEVNEHDFKLLDWTEENIRSIIESNVPFRGKLGFDAHLHSLRGITFLKKICEKSGCYLVSVKKNPIDDIWEDRPKVPNTTVFVHKQEYSGLSHHEKIALLADIMAKKKEDAVVLKNPTDVCWLLNVRANDTLYTPVALSTAIVHKNKTVDWFIDADRVPPSVRTELGDKLRLLPPGVLEAELGRLARKRAAIHIDTESSTVWLENIIAINGGNAKIGNNLCAPLKAIKNATEIEGLKNAHLKDGAALCEFLAYMDENGTSQDLNEYKAATILEGIRAKKPLYHSPSFATISAFGANSAIVHYTPTSMDSTTIENNGVYMVDSGGQYLDGTTDVTRTIAIGDDMQEIVKRRYTQVLKGHIALATAIFPQGTYGNQLDTLARQYLWEDGADYAHGTGHGVGFFSSVHETPPSISPHSDSMPLAAGMVLSDEPGFYKEKDFGIRIENLLLIVPSKKANTSSMLCFEVLTLAPFDKKLILKDMLSEKEISWINEYHEKVLKSLTPLLDSNTLKWLKSATTKL